MRFSNPEWFFAIFILILILLLWRYRSKRDQTKLEKFFSKENRINLGLENENLLYSHLYRGFLILFMFFLVLSLARPQLGSKKASKIISERSVVFLVDLSRSMLTRDITPSRLDLTKFEIKKTLKLITDTKVGLIAFAGNVDLISPLTEDLSAIEDFIDSLSADSMTIQGTEIRTALDEAKGFFRRASEAEEDDEAFKKESKVIVLFTDGEDHQSDTLDFVKSMADENYVLITVGVGSLEGGYVPKSDNSTAVIKDGSGQPVISKPNFDFLKDISKSAKGSFFYLDPVSDLAPKLKKSLESLDSVKQSQKDFVVNNEVYQVFLILSLLSLMLSLVFSRLRE